MSEAPAPAGIRICFCDLEGHPFTDWDAHEGFCLALDWAMANGHITPQEFLNRLEGARADLGITDEEMQREAATMPGAGLPQGCAGGGSYAPPFGYRPLPGLRRPWFERAPLPAGCTRSEYGFMVHVKGACRCPRG